MRVKDLPTNPKAGVVLYCTECLQHYSANREDYCFDPPDEVPMHHGLPMVLARRTVTYEPLTPEEANDGTTN